MTSLLHEADSIINGEREAQYGAAERNLGRIAELWNSYLFAKYGDHGLDLSPEDVAWMMVQLKMARQMSRPKRDNLVDAAGYIGLIEKLETAAPPA